MRYGNETLVHVIDYRCGLRLFIPKHAKASSSCFGLPASVMDGLVDGTSTMSLSEQQRESATSGETSAGGGGTDSVGQEGTEAFRKACEHYSRGCSFVVRSTFS